MIEEPLDVQLSDIDLSYVQKVVSTFGWVQSVRTAGRAGTFIDLFFGGKTLKCLCPNDVLSDALSKAILRNDNKIVDESNKNFDEKNEVCASNNSNKMNSDEINEDKTNSGKTNIDNENEVSHSSNTGLSGKNVVNNASFNNHKSSSLTPHSSLFITARILPNASKRDLARHSVEAHILSAQVFCIAPTFPLNVESSSHTRLHLGHLALRTPERILFLSVRSELLFLFRSFYRSNSYVEITPPTLVQTQVEGGATLFGLDYYGKKAFLTQSSQLYLETAVGSCGKVFCIMPSYRAEKFNTTRHLSEYTHIEGELSNISFDGLMDEIEKMVKFVLSTFIENFKDRILDVHPKFDFESKNEILKTKFIRMRYSQAINELIAHKVYKDKEDLVPYKMGDDISDRDEVELVRIFNNTPIFLTHFPVEHKPFYVRRTSEKDANILESQLLTLKLDQKEHKSKNVEVQHNDAVDNLTLSGVVTDSCDLLWPGIGEILGGSMRCEDYNELLTGFQREGIDSSKYYWYLDLRRYGADKHGGYGLGFERLIKAVMDYKNVNEACLYPRFPGRCEP